MIKYLYIGALLALSGCSNCMNFEEVQKAEAYCTERGMMSVRVHSGLSAYQDQVVSVWCKDSKGSIFPPVVNPTQN